MLEGLVDQVVIQKNIGGRGLWTGTLEKERRCRSDQEQLEEYNAHKILVHGYGGWRL
jgi:hypothetical protein